MAGDSVARRLAREARNTRGRSMPRRTIACKPAGSTIQAVCLIFNARGTRGIAEAVEPGGTPRTSTLPPLTRRPFRRPVRDLAGRILDQLIINQLDFPTLRPQKIKRGPVARAPVRGSFTQRPPLWDRCFISKSGDSPTPRLPAERSRSRSRRGFPR